MESRSADHDREERRPLWQSPCRYFELLVNACLKCLGLNQYGQTAHSSATDRQQYYAPSSPPPAPQTEMEMKFTEEVVVMATRSTTRPLRVKRPPLNSGSGGQIN